VWILLVGALAPYRTNGAQKWKSTTLLKEEITLADRATAKLKDGDRARESVRRGE
jgi:hypothetical protein